MGVERSRAATSAPSGCRRIGPEPQGLEVARSVWRRGLRILPADLGEAKQVKQVVDVSVQQTRQKCPARVKSLHVCAGVLGVTRVEIDSFQGKCKGIHGKTSSPMGVT